MCLITTFGELERLKEEKLSQIIPFLHHATALMKTNSANINGKLLIKKKEVHEVLLLFLSHMHISAYFPLTEFWRSKGNENCRARRFQTRFCALSVRQEL